MTPEVIAIRHAKICGGVGGVVVDGFAGIGGNAMQFALQKDIRHVICFENDLERSMMAFQNISKFSNISKCDIVSCDFFAQCRSCRVRLLLHYINY